LSEKQQCAFAGERQVDELLGGGPSQNKTINRFRKIAGTTTARAKATEVIGTGGTALEEGLREACAIHGYCEAHTGKEKKKRKPKAP